MLTMIDNSEFNIITSDVCNILKYTQDVIIRNGI